MSQENLNAVRAVYAELAKGNFRAGVDLYDRNVMFIPGASIPDAGVYVGAKAIGDFVRGWAEPFTKLTVEAEEFIEAENSVVVAAHQRGEGTESGAATELRYFDVWTFRGRALVRREFIRSRAEALEAVGLPE